METKIKLSSIVLAKDEERNISGCINSQLNCIDEIIVIVDDSTKDNTPDIVKSFSGVRFVLVKWMGFSKTKQYGISLTTNEWILWIDADELITPELSNEINEFKKQLPRYAAYSVPRVANFLGRWIKHSGWYPGRVTRLFNKNFADFSMKDVHEDLIVRGEIGKLNNDLRHFTDPSINHYFEKFNFYTTLAAEELNKNSKKFRLSDIILRPFFLFVKMYFIKSGYLDGIQGFILAVFSSAYVFTKYCKLWELKNKPDIK